MRPWKRHTVVGLLAVLAVWPIVHRGLVARYEISPWKLYGWAMYCDVVSSVMRVRVMEIDGRRILYKAGPNLPPYVRREWNRFQDFRRVFGLLHEPDALGAALLRALPNALRVEIQVVRTQLDPESSLIKGGATVRYSYSRTSRVPLSNGSES